MGKLRGNKALRVRLLVLAVVLVPVASIWLGKLTSWSVASVTTQLIGSGLALVGLLVAYLRASNPETSVPNQLRTFLHRLAFGLPRPQLHKASATLSVDISLGAEAYGLSPLPDLTGLPTQQQVDLLADYIRNTANPRMQRADQKLHVLEQDVAKAHDHADAKAEQTYQRLLHHHADLQRQVNRVQVLDVRVAMFGLYIAIVGMALGY